MSVIPFLESRALSKCTHESTGQISLWHVESHYGVILSDCPFIKTGCDLMVIISKVAALPANFRNWNLTSSKSALEYAKHVCSVFFVTSYLKNTVLPLRVSLFWTKFIGKLLIGDNFIPMKKTIVTEKYYLLLLVQSHNYRALSRFTNNSWLCA